MSLEERKADATIVIAADTTQAKAGLDGVKEAGRGMATSITQSAQATGDALDKMAKFGERTSESFSRSEGSMRAAIQRATFDLENLGKTASQRFEAKLELKGIDKGKFEPYLAELRQVEAAQQRAATGLDKMGVSARQTAAALRGVPAQFTDIFTSLQGGQAPLTVLLQQGGQLKDMFGGVGEATRALGGYVAGLVNPFTLAAGAAGVLAFAYKSGSEEADEFRKALVLSGNQVGVSVGGLAAMAENISAVSGTTGAAAAALAQFAASGAVGATSIQKVTAAALDLEKFGGQAVAETVKQFKSLGDDPLKASIKLNEATNFLTTSLYEQIKALDQQGRTIEAANLAQTAYADTIKSRADEMKANLGSIEKAWLGIKSAAAGAWDVLKGVGRAEPVSRQIAGVQAQLADFVPRSQRRSNDLYRGPSDKEAEALREQLGVLNRIALKEQERATTLAQQALELDNRTAADKIRETLLTKQQKMEREIAATRTTLVRDGATQLEIEKAILAVKEKYADKPAKGVDRESISEAQRGLSSYVAELQKRLEKEEKLTEVQKAQNFLSSLGTAGQVPQVRELVLELAKKADALQAEEVATKAAVKAYDAYNKEQERVLQGRQKSAESAQAAVQKFEDEEKAVAIAAAQNITLAQAIGEVELARLREEQSKLRASNADGATLLAIQKEIAAREKLVGLISSKEVRESNRKSAEELERLITDSLLRGFDNGKGIAENFANVLENTFKTLILRPTIQATVQGALGTDGGAGGVVGALNGFIGGIEKAGKTFSAFSMAATDFQGYATKGVVDLSNTLNKAGFTDTAKALNSNAFQIGSYADKLATGLSYLEALSNFKDGSYGKSVGQGIGLAVSGGNPIIGQIGKTLGSYLDKWFGPSQGPTASGVSSTFTADGALTGRTKIGDTSNEAVNQFTSLLAVQYQQLAAKLGATTKASTFDFQTTTDGFFDVSSKVGNASFGQGRTQYSESALNLAASRAVFAALQGSELPGYLSKAFTGIVAESASQSQIDGALQFAESLKSIRFGLLSASEQAVEYQKIVDASTASLGTSADTFKQDFIKAIDEGLTQEGLAKWSALGNTLQALEQITGKTNETLRSAADIANERKRLQDELDGLTLSSTDLLAKQRDALDESNRALFDQVSAAKAAADASAVVAAALEKFKGSMSGLGDTRFGLENELLTLQGNDPEVRRRIRARELASLTEGLTDSDQIKKITEQYDYNQSLRDSITALQEAQKAQQAAQDAANRSAEEAARAAEQIKSAWQSVTDSIFDEVRRIRGLTGAGTAQSFAQAQANFSITAAQASAGDQAAAKALPELSRVLLELAEANATSLAQLRVIQGQTAATLDATGNRLAGTYGLSIPKLATGTNYIPQDGAYYLHKGEEVTPVAYNPANGAQGANADLVDQLRKANERLDAMARQLDALNRQSLRSANALNGNPEQPMPVETV
jgi:hypothetical protein